MINIQLAKLPTIACGIPNKQKFPQKYGANISRSYEVTAWLTNTTVAYKRFCSLKGTSLQLWHHLYHYCEFWKNQEKNLITSGVQLCQQSLQNKFSTCIGCGKILFRIKRLFFNLLFGCECLVDLSPYRPSLPQITKRRVDCICATEDQIITDVQETRAVNIKHTALSFYSCFTLHKTSFLCLSHR